MKASKIIKVWEKDGLTFEIVDYGHYCGYVTFPVRPTQERGYGGILTWAPVHGGITYAQKQKDGSMKYGFDCAHHGSPSSPSLEWLEKQCEQLGKGIRVAARYEAAYLKLTDLHDPSPTIRGAFLQAFFKACARCGIPDELDHNYGALIHLLSGSL
jgi:hypothetical protein